MHTLTSEQEQAVEIIKNNNVSILTGAPGVGKTFLAKRVIDQHIKRGYKIALCAPSGKAARRLSQSTGRGASTIHSMLQARMVRDEFVFSYCENNQMDIDMIVVDESSMLDSPLMASLMHAVSPKTKLLFIGDDSQLPPVGMGCVFRDMIASGVIPVAELTEIQRNSGQIVRACHKIKDGKSYTPSKIIDIEAGINLVHVECSSPQKIVQFIDRIVTEKMVERGYDPIWDVQVLSPTNKRTTMSCESINKTLQAKLNPNKINEITGFGPGDKVINTKNTTFKDGEYVANGDLGTIQSYEGNELIVRFSDPDREVTMNAVNNKLLHAYCCTTHRYQGSEVPVVIIPVHSSFNFFVTRPWIYTAISRAQHICITVGEFSAIESAIAKEGSDHRLTRLQERLVI